MLQYLLLSKPLASILIALLVSTDGYGRTSRLATLTLVTKLPTTLLKQTLTIPYC